MRSILSLLLVVLATTLVIGLPPAEPIVAPTISLVSLIDTSVQPQVNCAGITTASDVTFPLAWKDRAYKAKIWGGSAGWRTQSNNGWGGCRMKVTIMFWSTTAGAHITSHYYADVDAMTGNWELELEVDDHDPNEDRLRVVAVAARQQQFLTQQEDGSGVYVDLTNPNREGDVVALAVVYAN